MYSICIYVAAPANTCSDVTYNMLHVYVKCGHNFTKSALEALFRHNPPGQHLYHHHEANVKSCPVCKAIVNLTPSTERSNSFNLATNVVLRDTIERLYPHVLRRRAVDDIQVLFAAIVC